MEKLTLYLSGDAEEGIRYEIGRRLLIRGEDLLDVMNAMAGRCNRLLGQEGDWEGECFEGMFEEEYERLCAGDEEAYARYCPIEGDEDMRSEGRC